ncbi:MAG TPA: ATP-binding protein, partial [Chthoniobacterales bacterium]
VSQITSGKVRLAVRPINPAMLVRSAVDSVRLAAEARQIRLECEVAESIGAVLGDPDRLQQVFWNLLSNAIKFTPRQGRVSVYIDVEASHIRFAVRDTGEGIPPEFLPHVFDRFSQADPSSTRNHKGLGLGLAIARHLTELHGGTISVSSPGAGQGATFTVLLPCLSGSVPARADAPSENPLVRRELGADYSTSPPPLLSDELAGVSILAVEDHDDARAFLQQLLASKGAAVVAAASVDEAFRCLDGCLPDVILCDIQMPGEDGFAFIRALRARSAVEGGRIPAAALTAHARPEDRQRVLEAGFQLHVPKPIQSSRIIEVVSQLRHAIFVTG